MRQIKFRGLRTDGKCWVYGDYWFDNQNKKHKITSDLSDDNFRCYEVTPESVGQFTGLHDKNGLEIYDGDQFAPDTDNEEVKSVVRWDEPFAKFVVDSYGYNYYIGEGSQEVYDNELSICETYDLGDMILEYCEVIGNIHTDTNSK